MTSKLKNPLDCRISFSVGNLKTTELNNEMTLRDYVEQVKSDELKSITERYRESSEKEEKANIKSSELRYIIPSGIFSRRGSGYLIDRSGIIALDIDKQSNIREVLDIFVRLEFVPVAHITISGTGIRAFVNVNINEGTHAEYYNSLIQYFKEIHGITLDPACRDISRACLISWDPGIHVKSDSLTLGKAFVDEWGKKKPLQTRTTSGLPQKASFKINISTREKEGLKKEWIKQADEMILSAVDGTKHTALLKTSFKLGSLISYGIAEYEELKLTLMASIMKRASTVASMKLAERTVDEGLRKGAQKPINLEKEIVPIEARFWFPSDSKKTKSLNVGAVGVYQFLSRQGFYTFRSDGNSRIVRIVDNQVELVSFDDVRSYIFDYIRTLPWNIGFGFRGSFELEGLMRNRITTILSDKQIKLLEPKEIDISRDSKELVRLFYNNCVLNISKEGCFTTKYSELEAPIWRNRVINREYKEVKMGIDNLIDLSDFVKFLFLVCGQSDERFESMQTILGYLVSGYKDPANSKAIVLMDESLEDGANGGTGKGLIIKALSKIRPVAFYDGKRRSSEERFMFQNVDLNTHLFVFDDVRMNFDFSTLFSVITEGMTVEKKRKTSIHIPFDKSPHILISTNYTIKGVGSSFERRQLNFEMSNYFSDKHTPYDEFGHLLFNDWGDDQWNYFDNFIVQCVEKYLEEGLIAPPKLNIDRKKLINETDERFVEMMDDLVIRHIDQEIKLDLVKGNLFRRHPELEKANWLSTQRFKRWIELYGKSLGYTSTFRRMGNAERVLIRKNIK